MCHHKQKNFLILKYVKFGSTSITAAIFRCTLGSYFVTTTLRLGSAYGLSAGSCEESIARLIR